MKKILPMVIPVNACYPITSHASGILFADPLIHDWMMNNCIQVFEVDNLRAIDYYDFAANKNPFISYNEIDYSFIYNNWNSIEDFIKGAIKDNYYVRLFVNASKISHYRLSDTYYHDLMVYGYNDETLEFYIADHFYNGVFSLESCSYSELSDAVECFGPKKGKNPIFMYSAQLLKKECDFMRLRYSMYTPEQMDYIMTLNPSRIYQSLKNYISGTPVMGWFTRGEVMDGYTVTTHHWGIQCYDVLIEYIDSLVKGNQYGEFAQESFYVMTNHKTMMIDRIETLYKKRGLPNWNEHKKNFEQLEKLLKNITLRYIKYSISSKSDIFIDNNKEKIIEKCENLKDELTNIREMDIDFTRKLIDDICTIC